MRLGSVVLALSLFVVEAGAQGTPQRLGLVSTSATRVGLSGVVLDSAGVVAAYVEVRAIPTSGIQLLPISQRTYHKTVTDSSGVFFLPLVGGGYEIRVEVQGKGRISAPIYVPKTESRCVVIGFAAPDELLQQGRSCPSP